MWKSPFLAIGTPHHRKIIDEFYFVLDDASSNKFQFSVYKDYDSQYADDKELIYSTYFEHFIWSGNCENDNPSCNWATDDSEMPIWPVNKDVLEKAEISEANYAIQLCVEGSEADENANIIGLQFREIYNDD